MKTVNICGLSEKCGFISDDQRILACRQRCRQAHERSSETCSVWYTTATCIFAPSSMVSDISRRRTSSAWGRQLKTPRRSLRCPVDGLTLNNPESSPTVGSYCGGMRTDATSKRNSTGGWEGSLNAPQRRRRLCQPPNSSLVRHGQAQVERDARSGACDSHRDASFTCANSGCAVHATYQAIRVGTLRGCLITE